jgi:hypothetical protein
LRRANARDAEAKRRDVALLGDAASEFRRAGSSVRTIATSTPSASTERKCGASWPRCSAMMSFSGTSGTMISPATACRSRGSDVATSSAWLRENVLKTLDVI